MTTNKPLRATRTDVSLRAVLIAVMGLGGVDLLALNFWAVPVVLQQTSIQAVRSLPLPAAATVEPVASATSAGPTPARTAPTPRAPRIEVESLGTIDFEPGTWWVGRESREILAEMLPHLAADQRIITVVGYADTRGSPALNQRISEERARAVVFLLVHAGIPERRIRARGIGAQPDGRNLGRHVEISLITTAGAP